MLAAVALVAAFLYFSSSVDPLFPTLLFTDSRSLSPFSCLWLIAGDCTVLERQTKPFQYLLPAGMEALEREFVTTVVDRIENQASSLLFFDRNVGKQAFGMTAFDFERYFLAEPRFASLLEKYRSVGDVESATAYRRIASEKR